MPVIARGDQSVKNVEGKPRNVVPFVGTDRPGEFSQFGIGIYYTDGEDAGRGQVWGPVMPRQLLKSWRAMKLLEHIPVVEHGTLCACWYAADANPHETDLEKIDELAKQFGSQTVFNSVREEIVASFPSPEEFDAMLKSMNKQGIEFETWELTPHIAAGSLPVHPLVEAMAEKEDDRRQKHAETERKVKEPVPDDRSLSKFFSDLGIGNFIIGGGFGGYGFDWGHIGIEQLDETAKRDSFSEYLQGFRLEHTTEGPETRLVASGPGVRMYSTSFGQIENPYFVATDGTKYTFTRAVYKDDRFWVTTKVEGPNGSPTEEEYQIDQLREMIGPLPPKPSPSFWRRFVPGFLRRQS